jgi:hypothetical protein
MYTYAYYQHVCIHVPQLPMYMYTNFFSFSSLSPQGGVPGSMGVPGAPGKLRLYYQFSCSQKMCICAQHQNLQGRWHIQTSLLDKLFLLIETHSCTLLQTPLQHIHSSLQAPQHTTPLVAINTMAHTYLVNQFQLIFSCIKTAGAPGAHGAHGAHGAPGAPGKRTRILLPCADSLVFCACMLGCMRMRVHRVARRVFFLIFIHDFTGAPGAHGAKDA